MCDAILKTGKRKGGVCGRVAKYQNNTRCYYHAPRRHQTEQCDDSQIAAAVPNDANSKPVQGMRTECSICLET